MRPRRRAGAVPAAVCGLVGVLSSAAALASAGGEAVIGMQLEPPILDPTQSPAASITEIEYGNVFEGLVSFAADGSAQPGLAESWEISADGLRYDFHLRAGVRFHDGTPFDASTAKYSLERAIAPGSVNPQKPRLAAIGDIEVIDALTLRLVLKHRSGGLLQSLAWGAFVMVAPGSAAGNTLHPIGTGPFKFSNWRRGDSIRFVRNEDYRGRPAPLERVTFKFIGDPTAAYVARWPATSTPFLTIRRRRASRSFVPTGASGCSSARPRAKPSCH